MLKKLPFYILIILGAIALKFFDEYNGTAIEHPEWIAVAGIGCWLLAAFFLWRRISRSRQKVNKDLQQKITDLVTTGELIRIPAELIELKENKHAGEHTFQSGEVVSQAEETFREMIDLPNRQNPAETTESHQTLTTMIYRHKNAFTGKTELFASKPIPKDKITLALYIERQATLLLYVNRNNRGEYYFDTEFLHTSL